MGRLCGLENTVTVQKDHLNLRPAANVPPQTTTERVQHTHHCAVCIARVSLKLLRVQVGMLHPFHRPPHDEAWAESAHQAETEPASVLIVAAAAAQALRPGI